MREMLFVDVGTLDEITSQTVQEWASILFERVRAGSRALGDAIVASGEAADTGDFRSAALEMRRFVDLCDMPFYREIAMNRLCEYDAR